MNVEKSLECLIQLVDKLLQKSRRSSSSSQDIPQCDLQDKAAKKGRTLPLLVLTGGRNHVFDWTDSNSFTHSNRSQLSRKT